MELMRRLLLLAALSQVLFAGCGPSEDASGDSEDGDPFQILPCAEQSWQCGKWERPAQPWDPRTFHYSPWPTPDGTTLPVSVCESCGSLRIIDPNRGKERILASVSAQGWRCEHNKWSRACHTGSIDPVRVGDLLLIAYRARLYILAVDKIFPGLRYRIASMAIGDSLPSAINLGSLRWRRERGDYDIRFGERQMLLFMYGPDDAFAVTYDYLYGYMGRDPGLEDEHTAFIAIVHKSDLSNGNVVEPGRFRFKTWEDGLGNLCPPSSADATATQEKGTQSLAAADPNDLWLRLPAPRDNNQTRKLVDALLGEDEFVEIALKEASEINSCEIGELSARFDVGNKEWLEMIAGLEEVDEESARFFRKRLDNRSYQAVHVAYKEPHIGGGYTILMDKGTGKVITFAAGL
jgi:hypothetical protein